MRKEDVKKWIESCDLSLKRKGSKQKHRLSLTWKTSYPFLQVSVGNMGSLLQSQGNKNIF